MCIGIYTYLGVKTVIICFVFILCYCGAYLQELLHTTEPIQGFAVTVAIVDVIVICQVVLIAGVVATVEEAVAHQPELGGAVLRNHTLQRRTGFGFLIAFGSSHDILVSIAHLPHPGSIAGGFAIRCCHFKIVGTLEPHRVGALCAILVTTAINHLKVVWIANECPVQAL